MSDISIHWINVWEHFDAMLVVRSSLINFILKSSNNKKKKINLCSLWHTQGATEGMSILYQPRIFFLCSDFIRTERKPSIFIYFSVWEEYLQTWDAGTRASASSLYFSSSASQVNVRFVIKHQVEGDTHGT